MNLKPILSVFIIAMGIITATQAQQSFSDHEIAFKERYGEIDLSQLAPESETKYNLQQLSSDDEEVVYKHRYSTIDQSRTSRWSTIKFTPLQTNPKITFKDPLQSSSAEELAEKKGTAKSILRDQA
jgi:hypothetical protein